ncbi:ABC transporter permease subunit [Paenibacillus qinlingensis]|uniref:Aldouronate transport system permease protein n=1 Tax=Paenibacillus qinlingensis TaxID=1837343 RepID=A0ABU1NYE2_9BACL|nr:ABC transporter permease subunit [Paenibacillus qinlingensis]MDR6552521.1 putative aldouronate transport system permease protein [Paenibacillus qinlingensis]
MLSQVGERIVSDVQSDPVRSRGRRLRRKLWSDRYMYLLALPGILFILLFDYVPMYGILMAFQDYNPFSGISHSEWVGFEHFERLFHHPDFWMVLRNTLVISLLNLVLYFPAPVVIALLLNEVRGALYKKLIQTVIYLPHFVSWVVVCSLTVTLMNSQGIVTKFLHAIGIANVQLLLDERLFWGVITLQSIWKDAGWGTIIFLAALAGINPELYEAARVDGANRWQQMKAITLPALMGTIVVLLLLRMGSIMNLSFDQLFIMGNPMVNNVAEVFDTYVFKVGVLQGNFSFAAAVGLFKSLVGLVLILGSNFLAKKTSDNYLF